jgi:DNA-binding response OmpR family regulator
VRILLVEDDRKLGPLLARVLSDSGYAVVFRPTASEAMAVRGTEIDLAVVDWMLPDGDGLAVCTHLRRDGFQGGILMLTARGEIKDRVQALDQGVDDYLTKPFAMDELLARLRALLRRPPAMTVLELGELHIDVARRNAFGDGKLLELTAREFDLLVYLARRGGEVVTKAQLIESVWDAQEIVPNVVEVHVSRLRDKLGDRAWMLETVRGVGYRLRAELP